MKELNNLDLLNQYTDNIPEEINLDRKYEVSSDLKGEDITTGFRLYTDGSKNKDGTGAGICLMERDNILHCDHIGLSNTTNIFQAELRAIAYACEELCTHPNLRSITPERVHILTDSLSAVQALSGTRINSRMPQATVAALNKLGEKTQIQIKRF